jgi:L-malate glycosyltransferase
MKVIHILSGDLWAGAEVMVRNLLRGLQKSDGIELRVVVLNHGRPAEEIKDIGIKTLILDENTMSFFALLAALGRELSDFQPDIIHTHRYKESLLAYLSFKKRSNAVLITTQHGMPETYSKPFSLRGSAIQFVNLMILSCFFDSVVVVSEEMKNKLLLESHFRPKGLKVIHNGIEIPHHIAKKQRNFFVVGSCGRLTPVKNYSLFIEIAAKVYQVEPKIRFELAGDGPYRGSLQKKVDEYGLESVFIFHGHLDNMEDFFSGLDVYVNTSLHEGCPMSVLEAMGHALPVIVPNVGGLNEIVTTDRDGLIVNEYDSDLFAEKILELYHNSARREKIGEYARQKVINNFSINHMAQQYLQLYKQLH